MVEKGEELQGGWNQEAEDQTSKTVSILGVISFEGEILGLICYLPYLMEDDENIDHQIARAFDNVAADSWLK